MRWRPQRLTSANAGAGTSLFERTDQRFKLGQQYVGQVVQRAQPGATARLVAGRVGRQLVARALHTPQGFARGVFGGL
jgi:hypothetical protein